MVRYRLVIILLLCSILAAPVVSVNAASPAYAPAVGMGWLFYFAEGSTQPGFTTWLLLANPNAFPIPTYVSYYKEDGTVIDKTYSLPPTSRTTILVNNEVPNAALAIKVQADYQIS